MIVLRGLGKGTHRGAIATFGLAKIALINTVINVVNKIALFTKNRIKIAIYNRG